MIERDSLLSLLMQNFQNIELNYSRYFITVIIFPPYVISKMRIVGILMLYTPPMRVPRGVTCENPAVSLFRGLSNRKIILFLRRWLATSTWSGGRFPWISGVLCRCKPTCVVIRIRIIMYLQRGRDNTLRFHVMNVIADTGISTTFKPHFPPNLQAAT